MAARPYPMYRDTFRAGRPGPMHRREEARSWSRRYKINLEKLASRDTARVAEVVGDLELREYDTGLTTGERRMLERARHLQEHLRGE